MPRLMLAGAALVAAVAAQDPAPALRSPIDHAAAAEGKVAGTKRYNVTFAQRPFDLTAFREAIAAGATADQVDAIVADLKTRAQKHQAPFEKAITAMGGRLDQQFWLINACTIEVRPDQVEAVRGMDNVLLVDPDRYCEVQIATATNASNHNADAVQAAGINGAGFAVAIIDTGLDSNMSTTGRPHRTFFRNGDVTNLTGGGLGGSRLLENVSFGAVPADNTHSHGTGVAGIAAGEMWGNAAGDRGHANEARFVGYGLCNVLPSCTTTFAIEATAWQQAAADRVRYNIVAGNMSYGSSPSITDVSQQAIDAAAINADLLPVCAAANGGSSTAGSSATSNGLAVANVAANTKVVAGSSSRGPLNGDPTRFFPDIAACGTNTVMPQRDNEANNYVTSGTSMASPQVCGAATLVKAARPGSSARELKAILLATTESIAAQNPSLNRNAYGLGFLRDDLAVALAQRPGTVQTGSIDSLVTPNVHTISVSNGQQYSVVLVFHRHILTSTSFSNLGLRVMNGATVVASNDDPRNLYEKVTFTAPLSGNLTVEVSASLLEIASVPYSLATTATFVGAAPANWVLAGTGCPGQMGVPSLFPTGNPLLGTSMTTRLAYGSANALVFFAMGFSNTVSNGQPLPYDLGQNGAPGCFWRISADAIVTAIADSDGTASVAYGIPNSAGLIGLPLHQQAFCQDTPANALGFVVSNAGTLTVGEF